MTAREHTRPWGTYIVIYKDTTFWTKILTINPGQSLSLQYHDARTEFWYPLAPGLTGRINGSVLDLQAFVRYDVPVRVVHRIKNPTEQPISVIEVAIGLPDEDDIVRIADNYGRS